MRRRDRTRRALATAALASLVALSAGAAGAGAKAKAPQRGPAEPRTAAGATAAFGLDLLRELPPGNLVVSPNSVATALAMAGTGARGRTATEISKTLHLGKPSRFPSFGALQRRIAAAQAEAAAGDPEAPTLSIANGLFLQQGFALERALVAGLEQGFGASPQTVDFANDMPAALGAVNGWVSERTNGIIPQLFESLPDATQLVLANAIYFRGKWQHGFKIANTWAAPFHNRRGSRSVQFMHQTEELDYAEGKGYQAVELPYRASRLSMVVVLPRDQELSAFQHELDSRALLRGIRALAPADVELSLPHFHFNTHTFLNKALKSLGMPTAFSDAANFAGIAPMPLKISKVVHAADIEVNEEGTVAAAATGVVAVPLSAPAPVRRIRFNANHPFLFFLRDRATGAVLFAGRVVDPAAT